MNLVTGSSAAISAMYSGLPKTSTATMAGVGVMALSMSSGRMLSIADRSRQTRAWRPTYMMQLADATKLKAGDDFIAGPMPGPQAPGAGRAGFTPQHGDG
jgi:hypothetical protein